MERKRKIKNILLGVGIILVLGIVIVYGIVTTYNNKFYNFVIENVEKDVNPGEKIKVNNIEYASKKLVMRDIKLEVKNRKLYVNDELKMIDDDDEIIGVTGYYYQPSNTYNIYVLVDDEVYSLTNALETEIMDAVFIETEFDDVDKLILVDITVEREDIGQLPERNRVYAKIDNELVLVR